MLAKKNLLLVPSILAFGALCATASAQQPLAPDGTWYYQDQNPMNVGDFFATNYVAVANETVRVTDWAVVGDNYNVYVNGGLVASTNVADYTVTDPGNAHYTLDANVAWADPLFAHAQFGVNAGDIISIQETHIPTNYPDGTVAVSAVPEPASMLVLGLGIVALVCRRK